MLEYNADTPSLLLESSALQANWHNDKMANSNTHQSNYVYEAMVSARDSLSEECNKDTNGKGALGLVQVQEDEESTATMIFIKNVFGMNKDRNPELQDIAQLKLAYDNNCEPVWKFGQTPVSCVLNGYPSEWMITEIE